MLERNLPKDIAILIEDQGEARQRLEKLEEQFRSRVVDIFGEEEESKRLTLNGVEEVRLLISKTVNCVCDDMFTIDLEVGSKTTKICTIAPSGAVVNGDYDPCSLDGLLRLGRVLDLFNT